MVQEIRATEFFVAGGTLRPDASSYVQRPADDELFEQALAGEYCYVLTSRQMGKSSLMIRTDRRLKDEGVKTVIIDLTNIGTDVSIQQWYLGLLSRVKRRLRLEVDLEVWWGERAAFGYLQRFTDFLREVVMTEVTDQVVIFIDEIDSTLSLDFRDDFFAGVRALHNARAEDPNLVRLTFVLLGVAAPTELITDRSRTPFNIGHEITLHEFSYQDATILHTGLDASFPGQGETIFRRIYHWTNGHPYLTQKLCLAVTESKDGQWNDQRVDALVTKLFLTEEARKETNLKFVQDRILSHERKTDLLKLYRKVLRGIDIEDDGQSLLQNQLKLSGLVKVERRILRIRNQIYKRAFNENWIKENLPKVTPQRIAIVASVLAVIAVSIIVFLIIRGRGQEADVEAQTYIQQFENSQSSDVRLVSLAGLIELGEPYDDEAKNLFLELDDEERVALFENVSTPADLEDEIFTVVTAMYQDVPNTPQGNTLLDTMAEILGDVTVYGAPRLKTEIEFWLQARSLIMEEQPMAAISVYENTWNISVEREQPNPSVLFEGGVLARDMGDYDKALADFEELLLMNQIWEEVIQGLVKEIPEMYEYWLTYQDQYPALSGVLPTPTVISTPSATPVPPIITETPIKMPTETPDLNIVPIQTPQEFETLIIDFLGVSMTLVPAGPFQMGSEDGRADESPVHTVTLDNFYIDQYEVTNEKYAIFLNIHGNKEEGGVNWIDAESGDSRIHLSGGAFTVDSGYDDHPVTHVSWYGARTFCEWRDARLPTEAEWEKAARGGLVGKIYPWGDDTPICEYGVTNGAKFDDDAKCDGTGTEQVGSYAPNGYGVYDVAGNVREWVGGEYQVYPGGDPDSGMFSDRWRVSRGGSWTEDYTFMRVSLRYILDPWYRNNDIGFRCARDAPTMQQTMP